MLSENYIEKMGELFDIKKVFNKPEALKGIRVLDISMIIFGPATADFLGEMGAEIIKVEMPGRGDVMRNVAPEGYYWKNVSPAFFAQNHNKFHIAVDLHNPEGREIIRRLAARSDIFIENYRPGTTERKWQLGYRQIREINPSIIYVSNTGYGQWGPYASRPSYDALAQAVSGMSMITGFEGRPPVKIGIYLGDYFGACLSAVAVLAALYWRDKTGKGQYIEHSQCEALIRAMEWTWVYIGLTGKKRRRMGNRDSVLRFSELFRCSDGYVVIEADTDEELVALLKATGNEELYKNLWLRNDLSEKDKIKRIHDVVSRWVMEHTKDEIEEISNQYGFVCASVQNAKDHYEDQHLRARGSIWELYDTVYGYMVEYGPAPKLSETPGRFIWAGKPVGFHNEYVLSSILGMDNAEIKALYENQVIGKWIERKGPMPPDDWDGKGVIY